MMDYLVLEHAVPESWRAQSEVFSEIFFVFLVIGTTVGVVVVTYTLYHVYRYRDTGEGAETGGKDEEFDAPQLGELPRGQGGGKSKKLFMSFGLSAIIVISLVVYSYGLLLYVEQGPPENVDTGGETMDIEVTGYQFGWQFEYPNGHVEQNTLRVPQSTNRTIRLHVTSRDVWHAFGVQSMHIKADAIPGQTDSTWFIPDETGTHRIECFELCGIGHSQMVGEIIIMDQEEFDDWYAETGSDDGNSDSGSDGGGGE
jgi:cytochrome c oxidase subunit 2